MKPPIRIDEAPSDERWTERYLAYCRGHGVEDPREMLRIDALRFPGGRMAGFLTWRPT